jgi:Na+/H+ antiporter NhaD/arsenite permease-like protein
MISIIILILVFLLIATRRIGCFRFQIWQVMLAGAIAVLATGQITPAAAIQSINVDVILFLFGMFVIGEALVRSGYLAQLSQRLFSRARSLDAIVLIILFSMGLFAAILMNDTMAIIGTPLILLLASKNSISPKILLLTLAFAITIGSVMSPIGNPQNLLIAMSDGVANPFITFLRYLAIPTMINLLVAYVLLRLYYRREFTTIIQTTVSEISVDRNLSRLCQISLILVVVLIVVKIALVFSGSGFDFRLTYIALASALPVMLFSRQRLQLIKAIDWPTLIFFGAMFVLMASVWNSGFFQGIMNNMQLNLDDASVIMAISVILSQFISNVPMVALYLPVLNQVGATASSLMALAAGSTIAGNQQPMP